MLVFTALTAALVAFERCGGEISTGFFDQDGDFHANDGAVMFGPGTSCKGYDAAALTNTTSQWQAGIVTTSIACEADGGTTSDAYCAAALPAGLSTPANSPSIAVPNGVYDGPFYSITCADGTCGATAGGGTNVACPNADDTGNFYCQQFYQQFVAAAGAQAHASCKPCDETLQNYYSRWTCAGPYICVPDCCSLTGFCVSRDGGAEACEYPCEP